MEKQNDFTKGSISGNIMRLAFPMMAAQLINVLYSVVDRVYIGHLPDASTLALTGLGLTFPIIMIITAFANLFGMGGAPLCSIARGKGDDQRAERIMGNSFAMLLITGVLLMIVCLIFKRPILYAFGASDQTFPYANDYVEIYLCGSLFVMIGLGMNSFINSQGFAKIGMMTVALGAVVNILLDPVFIFVFGLGVRGAALATVLSQLLSSLWVLRFLTGKKAIYRLSLKSMRLDFSLIGEISGLGLSGFIMSVTNSAVQIVCNASLQFYGGDIYVGVMTVLNSIREVLTMPVQGITNGAQPVLGFNYGAGAYGRVRKGIQFTAIIGVAYTFIAWLILMLTPQAFIHIFNSEPELIRLGVPALYIYFSGFYDGAAILRPDRFHCPRQIETGDFLFAASKSNHCYPAHPVPANGFQPWRQRCFSGRAHLQFRWGSSLLYYHDGHCMVKNERRIAA
ncbi:MatE efflux family protein [Eubacterium limosum]|nr:MatE efflux family protein [Eubacterium limosum]